MAVEIRELVIQAKVQDKANAGTGRDTLAETAESSVSDDESEAKAGQREIDPELVEAVVERCMARMKEWLTEQSRR